jgi:hypothetical protein
MSVRDPAFEKIITGAPGDGFALPLSCRCVAE